MTPEEERFEWEVYQLVQDGLKRDRAVALVKKEKEFNDALWQYCIDHKQVQPNGYLGVLFYVRDREDLFKRIKSREDGFKRYDMPKVERGRLTVLRHYDELNTRRQRHADAKLGKNLFKKILCRLYEKYIYEPPRTP